MPCLPPLWDFWGAPAAFLILYAGSDYAPDDRCALIGKHPKTESGVFKPIAVFADCGMRSASPFRRQRRVRGFFGPSAGYLIAYPLAALLLSLSIQGLRSVAVPHLFIRQFLFGVLFLYVIGIPVQAFMMHIDILTAVKLSLIYVPGDLLKAAATSFATVRIRKTLQASRLLPTKGS